MFRKPRRNYRGRKDDSDDENLVATSPPSTIQHPTTVAPVHAPVKMSALSFVDDELEDIEVFRVKRTSHSRRAVKQLREGGTPQFADSDRPKPKDTHADRPERLEKTVSYPNTCVDLGQDLEIPKIKPLNRASSEQFSTMLKQGQIPDANAIYQARKQRQQAKFQLAADEESSNSPPPTHAPTKSANNNGHRLIRDDDDDEEDIDDDIASSSLDVHVPSQRRPAFQVSANYRDPNARRIDISRGLNRSENELRSIKEDFMAAEHGSDRESDQETEWERQQILKAISNQNSAVLDALQSTQSDHILREKTQHSTTDFANVTLASLKGILASRLHVKRTTVEANQDALEAARADLTRGDVVMKEARAKLPALAETLAFYLDLREYIGDVISCFNEKITKIEYLEKRSIMLYRVKADHLMSRRRADVRDLADEVAAASGSSDIKEDIKSADARRRRKADREARRTRRTRTRDQQGLNRLVIASETEKRLELIIGTGPPFDGVSSDEEESQAAIAKRAADFNDITNDAEHMFDDVVDEFYLLPHVLSRLAQWRARAPDTYTKAYIALCIPLLISPIVRLNSLNWNPLEAHSTFFDEQAWFGHLVDYFDSLPTSALFSSKKLKEEEESSIIKALDDLATSPDQELSVIPSTVEKLLLVRLTEIVSASWDPMSTEQSLRLTKLLRSFATLWPTVNTDSQPTRLLFEACLKRMELTIQSDIFIPLYSKQVMNNPQSPGYIFFTRQLNGAMKLVSNLLLWHDLIAPTALKHLTLTCVVNRYLLVGFASAISVCTCENNVPPNDLALLLQVAGRLKALVAQIPSDWLAVNKVESDQGGLTQLKRFVNQLVLRFSPDKLVLTAETQAEVVLKPFLKKLKQVKNRLDLKSA